MSLPYFFTPHVEPGTLILDEETSRHIVQVLRMKKGERLQLTDGNGNLATAELEEAHKKHCTVKISEIENLPAPGRRLTIGISLTKNASRFEWFLEKAAELGTAEIIPLICERTERQKFRHERMSGILKSAMVQSRQVWLTRLNEPQSFTSVVSNAGHDQRFIAHCEEDDKKSLNKLFDHLFDRHIVLVGPEGDFTPSEIETAKKNGFTPVSLGSTRLRTETAGVYAAVIGATDHYTPDIK